MKSSNVFIIILPIRMTSTKINILSPRESYAALLTTLAAVKLMETNVAWRRGQTSSNERSAYVKNNWRNIRWESTLTIVQLFLFHADLHHLFLSFSPSLSFPFAFLLKLLHHRMYRDRTILQSRAGARGYIFYKRHSVKGLFVFAHMEIKSRS